MPAAALIARAQSAALALMVDTCTVTRLSGQTNTPDTGQVVNTYDTVYTGPCKVQRSMRQSTARPENVGEAEVFMGRLELHLPVSAAGVASDDIVTVTASRDADLVGRVFHVRDPAPKTWRSAHRIGIEEVLS